MKRLALHSLMALFCGMSICSTALAKDSGCDSNLLNNPRAAKWAAQRAEIEYLETHGETFRNLKRAYRSLLEDLFDTDIAERMQIVSSVIRSENVLKQVDFGLPARLFTENLIEVMDRQQVTHEALLAKLHKFADLEAKKLGSI